MTGYSEINTKSKFLLHFPFVDPSEIGKTINAKVWLPPNPIGGRDVKPSTLFLELLCRMNLLWNRNSEPTTRTYIDQVILDVLWGRKNLRTERNEFVYKPFGEIKSNGVGALGKISGSADYILGYGDPQLQLWTFLLILEAKKYEGGMQPWQLFSEMVHFQIIREKRNKKKLVIYGILTDSEAWTFYRLDESQKLWSSRIYDFKHDKEEIWIFIDFIIDSAEKMSPSSTPFASQIKLFEDKGYLNTLERFIYKMDNDIVEDLTEAFELLYRL